jgi:hypothetical protein
MILEKWLDSVQWRFHPIQRCLNLVQKLKSVAAVKVSQLVVAKDNTIFGVAFVSFIKMAVRWIDAKQCAIAEYIRASIALWFPMVSIPCPAGAFVAVGRNQLLPTISAKPLLSFPSLLHSSVRKIHHNRTSQATHDVRVKGGYRVRTRIKNGWSQTASSNEWVRMVNGKETRLTIVKAPPWPPVKTTMYYIWYNSKQIGEARNRKQAISKAEAFFKRLKHA